jgi:hypothetical protein
VSPEFPFTPFGSLKYAAIGVVEDLCSEKGNYSGDDWELKTDKGKLPVAGKKCGYQLHVTERRHGAHFRADLLSEEFA